MHFKMQSAENIQITELGQHKNPKFFKYYKDIMIKDMIFTTEEKLKSLFLFELA